MKIANCKLTFQRLHRKATCQFSICIFQFAIFNVFLCFPGNCFLISEAQTPQQDVDVIRTETDLTNLLFTATDKNNRYITTLQQNDIRVLEAGVPQTLFTFQRETDRPLSTAFMMHVSIPAART